MTKENMIEKLLNKFPAVSLQDIAWSKSKKRTANVHELLPEELEAVYFMFFPRPITANDIIKKQQQEQRLRDLRSPILKDAQYIGLYDPQDWTSFNDFMLRYSPLKKQLNKYTEEEFGALSRQFKSLRTKYDNEAKIPGTKAWYHKNKFPKPSAN